MSAWQVDVSGATSVSGPDGSVDLRTKERAIVAALAIHHPTPVTAASLAPLVWGNDLPATAIKSIHNHVSRIRGTAPGLIDTSDTGYRFDADVDISSTGGTTSYQELADQPQVAVARARDRAVAIQDAEDDVRDRVRWGADDRLLDDLAHLVDSAPQRLIRSWWLALVLARLGRRQAALDRIHRFRRETGRLDEHLRDALDRFEQAIIDDDVFLDSPAASDPRSLGAESTERPDPRSTVSPVGILDATGSIAEVVTRITRRDDAVLCLVAPAGGGKTSALRSISTQLPTHGWHCFSTACSSIDTDPLGPLADLDRQRRERRGLPAARRANGELAGDWSLILLDALTEPHARPTLFVIDDLHHASPRTRVHVQRLADRIATSDDHLALITARRPEADVATATCETVDLRPWGHDAISMYLQSFVSPGVWSDGASRWIAERADGNPLFVRELSIDALRRLPDEPMRTPFVPPDVASLVTDDAEFSVENLPPHLRETLTIAAVLGDEFRLSDLAALVNQSAPMIALGRAHGLVERLDLDRCRFVHQTFRQSFLDLVDSTEQVDLASRVAGLIGRSGDAEQRLAELARFARTASERDPEYAIETTIAQANAAMDALRVEEASNIARMAMTMIEDVEGRTERWAQVAVLAGSAAVESGDHDAADLLVAGGTRAIELGAHDVVGRASSRLSSHGPTTRVGRIEASTARLFEHAYRTVTDPATRAMVCGGGAFAAALADDPDTSRRLFREALELSIDIDDRSVRAEILASGYTPLSQPADVPERRTIAAELHRLAPEIDRLDLVYGAHRYDLADAIHWGVGDPRVPMRHIEEIAAQMGQRSRNWGLFAYRSTIALLDGDVDAAEHHAGRLLTDDVSSGMQLSTTTYGALLLGLRLLDDRLDELDPIVSALQQDQPQLATWGAVRVATSAVRDPATARAAFDATFAQGGHRIPANFTMLAGLLLAGEGAFRLGDPERMQIMVDHLAPFADRWAWFSVGTVGPVDLTLARLHSSLGDRAAMRAAVRRGLASTARVGAPRYAQQLAEVLRRGSETT